MQIHGPEDEVLLGSFHPGGRTAFVENYEKAFGRGTIELDVRTCPPWRNHRRGIGIDIRLS